MPDGSPDPADAAPSSVPAADPSAPAEVEVEPGVEAAPAGHRRRWRSGSGPAGLLGAMTGLAVVAVLIATGHLTTTVRFGDQDASDAFIQAWTRSRSGTFVVDSTWQRQLADGSTLDSSQRLAQAPGRRLVRQFGGISGELDGRAVDCYTVPGQTFQCAPDRPTGQSFDDSVAEEARDVSDAIRSPGGPRYRVRTDDHGCFELTQTRAYPDPSYGRAAVLCFDGDTGALRSSERDFGDVVERIKAVSIRTDIEPSDFDLTPDDEFGDASANGPISSFAVGRDNPGSTPGSTSSPSGSTASPPSTAKPVVGDPCQPGPTFSPSDCDDAGLLKACVTDEGDIVSVGEAFKRHISFNDPAIAATSCGRQYVLFGLRHGAVPH